MLRSFLGQKTRPRFSISRFFIVSGVLIPLIMLGVAAWRDYHSVVAQVEGEVKSDRDVLQQYSQSLFLLHEVIAKSVINRIRGLSWDEVQASADLHEYLVDIARQFPQMHSIWVSDAEGTARATNLMFPVPFISAAHREYFHLLKSTNAPIIIAKPFMVQAGAPGEVFSISFRITKPDGTFGGFIGTAIPTDRFKTIFMSMDDKAERGAETSLIREDGEVIVRVPSLAKGSPTSYASDKTFTALIREHELDSFEQRGALDAVDRLYSFAHLDGFPLYIGRGISQATIIARWTHNLRTYALFAASAMTVLLMLAFYGWRQHRMLVANAANLESLVEDRTRHLNAALAEKTAFFRETHHRVKNNLQIISSLARLQGIHGSDHKSLERRIQAMALVHELLYAKPEASNLVISEYIQKLCAALQAGVGQGVECKVEADPVTLDLERAIPFALILSEVVTNAYKHGRPVTGGFEVSVRLVQVNDELVLEVKDNGPGHSGKSESDKGFGMKLIKSLTVQLAGTIEFINGTGTTFQLRFPVNAAKV